MCNGNMVAVAAQQIRNEIANVSKKFHLSVCELEAEILSQSLLSDDDDRCHVYWLEFHKLLEQKLMITEANVGDRR